MNVYGLLNGCMLKNTLLRKYVVKYLHNLFLIFYFVQSFADINDYSDNKYNILIDSVYSGNDVIPFLERSYKDLSRIGKVAYSYTD